MVIEEYIVRKKKLIDKALDRYLPSSDTKPKVLHEAMRYSVLSGGKRIRPILAIASFEACGGKANEILSLACSIELIHAYTLIHDDLPALDNDDYRRGKPTCHKKFGEDIALLAGDSLLTLSFEILADTKNIKLIKKVSHLVGSSGTIGGQVADIRHKLQDTLLRQGYGGQARHRSQDLEYIARQKTGALFEAAIVSAGILKGVSKKKLNALTKYSKCIGLTFQLIDDLLDKDGYYKLHGAEYIDKRANLLIKKAKSSISIFGSKRQALADLADLILKRRA
ncbi:MAG: polyprenyl synthetase family protein [Candidatus Omnitrophota bacterium]